MDRREAIKRTALLMGSAVSAPNILGMLQGCSTKPNLDWKPTFFTEDQAYVVSQVAEIYIPQTDTPGAKQLGIPSFIEQIVSTVYDEATQSRYMTGLSAFMTEVQSATGDTFDELVAESQIEQVQTAHDKEVTFEREKSKDFDPDDPDERGPYKRPFITLTKELTLLGFFTTEVGATEVLQYEAVPGGYAGCKPLDEVGGKTWAT